MTVNKFVGHGEGWNNVAAGAASGNENTQFRQPDAFQTTTQWERRGICRLYKGIAGLKQYYQGRPTTLPQFASVFDGTEGSDPSVKYLPVLDFYPLKRKL
jgi:hypothetical protein